MNASTSRTAGALSVALATLLFVTPAEAISRRVYDFSLGNVARLNFNYFGYYLGRGGSQPPRGPSPPGMILPGSTDVDDLFDYFGSAEQYYMEKFGRNGPNGRGGLSTGVLTPFEYWDGWVNGFNPQDGYAAAAFTRWPHNNAESQVTGYQGLVGFTAGWVAPDVVGHELAHILIHSSWLNPDGSSRVNPDGTWVTLTYQGESGALHEGLADFFGEAFEVWVTGSTDWETATGVDGTLLPRRFRNLSNPPSVMHTTGGGRATIS